MIIWHIYGIICIIWHIFFHIYIHIYIWKIKNRSEEEEKTSLAFTINDGCFSSAPSRAEGLIDKPQWAEAAVTEKDLR